MCVMMWPLLRFTCVVITPMARSDCWSGICWKLSCVVVSAVLAHVHGDG